MTDKIKIGENEYQPPFKVNQKQSDHPEYPDMFSYWVADSNGKSVNGILLGEDEEYDDLVALRDALNELASLRQERDELKREIQEAVEIIEADEACLKAEFGPNGYASDADEWLQRNKPTTKDGQVTVITAGERASESKSERYYNPFLNKPTKDGGE